MTYPTGSNDYNNPNSYGDQNYNNLNSYGDQNYNNYNSSYQNSNQNNGSRGINLRKPQPDTQQPLNNFQIQMLSNEYQSDREYIHKAISDALKEDNITEAIAFIDKYRSVASNDPVFNELVLLAERNNKKNELKSRLLIHLDSTPDNDYKTKAELYQQLLRLEPNHVDYARAFDNCLNHLPADVKNQILGTAQNNTNIQGTQNSSEADNKPKPVMSTGAAIASGFYCIIAFFGVIVLLMEFDAFALALVISCIIAFLMLTNLKFNPLKDFPTVAKICIAFMVWIFMLIAGAALFIDETKEDAADQPTEITAPEQPNVNTGNTAKVPAGETANPIKPLPSGTAVPAN